MKKPSKNVVDDAAIEVGMGSLELCVIDRNQIYIGVPDEALPDQDSSRAISKPLGDHHSCTKAAIIAFVCSDVILSHGTNEKYRVELSPSISLKKDAAGNIDIQVNQDIHHIKERAAGYIKTMKTIEMIDALLNCDFFDNPEQFRTYKNRVMQSNDASLIGMYELLSAVSDEEARKDKEKWQQTIVHTISATIEALVNLSGGPSGSSKEKDMDSLKSSIQSYFMTIDPNEDVDECKNFTSCVRRILLDNRREDVVTEKTGHGAVVGEQYNRVIGNIERRMSTGGASVSLLPKPIVRYDEDTTEIIINISNIIMATKFGGLSIKLDTTQCGFAASKFRGWDEKNPGQLHIVSKMRLKTLLRRSRR